MNNISALKSSLNHYDSITKFHFQHPSEKCVFHQSTFDTSLNKTFSIYPRILLESINNAIVLKMDKIVLGRTANEFKSNFGAKPIKSYVYIKVKNRFLSIILNPILKRLTVKKWVIRNPFKNVQKTINKLT